MRLRILALSFTLAACTAQQDRGMQQVRVLTQPQVQASCSVSNSGGNWYVITPGTLKVRRTRDPLTIRCNQMNYAGGISVAPQPDPWMAVASTVDGFTGPLYDYPATITVPLYPTATR